MVMLFLAQPALGRVKLQWNQSGCAMEGEGCCESMGAEVDRASQDAFSCCDRTGEGPRLVDPQGNDACQCFLDKDPTSPSPQRVYHRKSSGMDGVDKSSWLDRQRDLQAQALQWQCGSGATVADRGDRELGPPLGSSNLTRLVESDSRRERLKRGVAGLLAFLSLARI